MNHSEISSGPLTIYCPSLLADALLVPRLSLLLDLISGVVLNFTTETDVDHDRGPSVCLTEQKIANPDYLSERVGTLSLRAYGPKQWPVTGWASGHEDRDATEAHLYGLSVFEEPPRLRIDDSYLRIISAKRAGLAVVLPDVIGRLDPELSELSGDCMHRKLWLSVDRRSARTRGLHQTAIWVRGCVEAMSWLNDPPNDTIWTKCVK